MRPPFNGLPMETRVKMDTNPGGNVDRSHEANVVLIINIFIYTTVIVFVLFGTFAPSVAMQDLALSRLATIYSLTEHGTFYLDSPGAKDDNPFASHTIDKVMAKGRLLSSKPPVLPLMMTGEYMLLRSVFGLELRNDSDCAVVVRVLTLTFCGIPFILTVFLFDRTISLFSVDPLIRCAMTLFLAFGTQLWGYSLMVNNHIPATFCLMLCIYLSLGLIYEKCRPSSWRFAVFGAAAGLVLTIDMPVAIWPAIAGLCLVYHFPRKTLLWGVLAAAVPVAVHAGVMLQVTGSPLPVQMHPEMYLYENSYWRHPRGIDGLNEPKGTYLFHMTFGRRGIFTLYPVLIAGLLSPLRYLLGRGLRYHRPILAGALGLMILTAYYCLQTNDYGGVTYGFRWLIAAMPVLLLMGVPIYEKLRARWKWIFVGLMFGISFFSAWQASRGMFYTGQEWPCQILGPNAPG